MVDCFFPCQLDSLLNHTEKDGEKQDIPDVHERKHVGNKFDQNSVCMQYRWFSWGVASLPEGKSRSLCLAHLCA